MMVRSNYELYEFRSKTAESKTICGCLPHVLANLFFMFFSGHFPGALIRP